MLFTNLQYFRLSVLTCLNQTFLTTHPCFFFPLFLAETFKQVAKTVTDVDLTDNIVDVVYKMFDENGNTVNFNWTFYMA